MLQVHHFRIVVDLWAGGPLRTKTQTAHPGGLTNTINPSWPALQTSTLANRTGNAVLPRLLLLLKTPVMSQILTSVQTLQWHFRGMKVCQSPPPLVHPPHHKLSKVNSQEGPSSRQLFSLKFSQIKRSLLQLLWATIFSPHRMDWSIQTPATLRAMKALACLEEMPTCLCSPALQKKRWRNISWVRESSELISGLCIRSRPSQPKNHF